MNNIEGMKNCLKLIEDLRNKYAMCGWIEHDLSIDRVLNDIENAIGIRCIKDWRIK